MSKESDVSAENDHDEEDQQVEEEDPFWQIALHEEFYASQGLAAEGGADYDDDVGEHGGHQDTNHRGKFTKYHLPGTSLILELAPLPLDEGIWAPVGAEAWYSSALLASMILSDVATCEEDRFSILPKRTSTASIKEHPFRVLELGSGAVGLSGLACAAAMSLMPNEFPFWNVRLTDNHPGVLDQLQANVEVNLKQLGLKSGQSANKIVVECLDWSDADDGVNHLDNGEDHPEEQVNDRPTSTYAADLVIGSELVYTSETGTALINLLFLLLRRNPSIRIFVVQVVDRYGWSEIVIPALESAEGIFVRPVHISWNVHEMASSLIRMGGTLDRHAYGAFCIGHVAT